MRSPKVTSLLLRAAAWSVLAATTVAGAAADGPLPLFAAIDKRDVETVRRLVAADPQLAASRDRRGNSAVLRALFVATGEGFVPRQKNEMMDILLARKPPLDFFETCAVGTADAVDAMLRAAPKLAESWSPIGWTPLHFASFTGNRAVMKTLLARGARVNEAARSRFRNSPLAVALLTQQIDAARLLIEHAADVNLRQAGGLVPLHEAALAGRRDLIDLLLESGADVNARANDGRNAVSEAERGKHTEIAAYLRTKGGADARITADMMAAPKE
jgi:ankyrin repeat protein